MEWHSNDAGEMTAQTRHHTENRRENPNMGAPGQFTNANTVEVFCPLHSWTLYYPFLIAANLDSQDYQHSIIKKSTVFRPYMVV